MAEKLTPWFPGDVKPVYEGVYPRDFGCLGPGFSKFDGHQWLLGCNNPDDAAVATLPSHCQSLPWRGLAQDPSKEGV